MISRFFHQLKQRDPLNYRTGWLLLMLCSLFLLASVIDSRQLAGSSVWLKPARFSLSIAIFLWSISWYSNHLAITQKHRKRLQRAFWGLLMAEYLLIVMQAARGVASHFNHSTWFNEAVFIAMGLFIGLATLLVCYMLLLFFILKHPLPLAYLWGLRWGLIIFLMAAAIGVYMIMLGTHSIGNTENSLYFLNWNASGGDLRVAHFVGLHALQLMPFLSWFLYSNQQQWRIHFPVIWVFSFALIYVLYSLYVTFVALAGMPYPY